MKKSKVFYVNLIYFICACLIVTLYIIDNVVDLSFINAAVYDIIFSVVLQVGIMFVLPLVLYSVFTKQKPKQTFMDFRYNKLSTKSVIYCIVIGICCYFLNLAIASFFSSIIRLFGYETLPSNSAGGASAGAGGLLLELLLVALLPAVCEENLHRGLLLGGYSKLGLKKAVILSSLLFGLLHLNVNQFFYATILGFLMAMGCVICKSIYPGMIIHFLNNGLSIYLNYATNNKIFGGGILPAIEKIIIGGGTFNAFISSFLFLSCLVGLLLLFYYLLLKEMRIKKVRQLFNSAMKIETTAKEKEQLKQIDPNAQPFSNTYINNLEMLNSMLNKYNGVKDNKKQPVFTQEESSSKKFTLSELMLLIGSLVLTISITVFTFIWGLL